MLLQMNSIWYKNWASYVFRFFYLPSKNNTKYSIFFSVFTLATFQIGAISCAYLIVSLLIILHLKCCCWCCCFAFHSSHSSFTSSIIFFSLPFSHSTFFLFALSLGSLNAFRILMWCQVDVMRIFINTTYESLCQQVYERVPKCRSLTNAIHKHTYTREKKARIKC